MRQLHCVRMLAVLNKQIRGVADAKMLSTAAQTAKRPLGCVVDMRTCASLLATKEVVLATKEVDQKRIAPTIHNWMDSVRHTVYFFM